MDLGTILKVVHALVGVLFVAGLVGRWITLGAASRAASIGDARTLLDLSGRFERIVIGSSILVLLLGVVTAIAQGRPFLGPLQAAPVDWLFVSLVLYLSIIPLVPLVFLPHGRLFEAALDEATAGGTITDRLHAAFRDPIVRAAHASELAATVTILVLMIWKPF
jgi:hypothetical protein